MNPKAKCQTTPMSSLVAILLLSLKMQIALAAFFGDGRSIYTGQLIDRNDTRGSCLADGEWYPSETSIPREHPCHYCICYQTRISCYWKQCGAPPQGCETMFFENVCNPSLFVCEIPERSRNEPLAFGARINRFGFRQRRRRIRRSEKALAMPVDEGFPVQFDQALEALMERRLGRSRRKKRSSDTIRALESIFGDTSCTILGVRYLLGEVIGVASDVCMECRCAAGEMFCSPKCCFQPSQFNISPHQEQRFRFKANNRGDELRSHPLHYIQNQIA